MTYSHDKMQPSDHGFIEIRMGKLHTEIEFFVYPEYFKAFAHYYYKSGDSIIGSGTGSDVQTAIKLAVLNLKSELEEHASRGSVFATIHPQTKRVAIVSFQKKC